ncbi:hypothetical protein [Hydrogenophaga sp.]|uniref:hypothetical protein n=1 Tax=Hydrogenophaga sp. TaxID=1904254 RepID=UPI0035AF1923
MNAKHVMPEPKAPLCEDVSGWKSINGTRAAILNFTGIDICELPQVMDGSGVAVVMKDGHQWTITPWEGGGGFAMAERPKTKEEIERDWQRMLRRTFVGYFSEDRRIMCAQIAERLREISVLLRPDHPPARAMRRSLQRKLNRLAEIQMELLCNRNADSSRFEQELKLLGA